MVFRGAGRREDGEWAGGKEREKKKGDDVLS